MWAKVRNQIVYHSKIEELAPRIFYKLRSLKTLDLSGNRLEHVDGGVFVDTPNLEMFSCEHCGLFKVRQQSMSHSAKCWNGVSLRDTIHWWYIRHHCYVICSIVLRFQLHIPDHHQLNKLHTLRLSNNTFTRVQDIHNNFLANIQARTYRDCQKLWS